jgi:hypothetical protein
MVGTDFKFLCPDLAVAHSIGDAGASRHFALEMHVTSKPANEP